MVGRKAEGVLNRAVRYAVEHEHEYFTIEHVLWSLLAESEIVEILAACGGDSEELRLELEAHLGAEVPKKRPSEGCPPAEDSAEAKTPPRRSGRQKKPEGEDSYHPVATLGVQRLVQRALFQVQSAGKDEIFPVDLFVAIFQAKDSQALFLLLDQGIERLDVLEYVSHGIDQPHEELHFFDEVREHLQSDREPSSSSQQSSKNSKPLKQGVREQGVREDDPLSLYAQNLNQRALMGKVDPLIGRHSEIERVIQVLCRRRKNNPLLVGEAGVGKTALAEGLALRIIEKKVPAILHNSIVYALDLGSLIAGAKFRGDFEQRLKQVLGALQKQIEKGIQPILLIDEIHTIIGAGAVSGGVLDAANLLKPALTQGEIRCMGSTTYAEYRSTFEKDHALARRFQKIDISEPNLEEAIQVLNGLKARFEEHHGVRYTHEAIRTAVELSSKYLTDRFLPDKAIDVIDEAGAKARLKNGNGGNFTYPNDSEIGQLLDSPQIEEVIAQIARIPARSVNTSQKDRLKSLERDLKLTIFGQDRAIDAVVTAIRLARSGLRNGDRPVGSFLFCGPTGVGKTELSKQLALCLGVPFLRFDMSEYGEKHTLSRLIGAPPGYVGFEQAGLLTEAAMKNAHSVILLDEIEKAHSDIWNVLLQVMDHGTLTDNNGRKADFRNAVILMTSNVGSREMERRGLGISSQDVRPLSGAQKAVEQTFSPEFRNRLDAIVHFNPLDSVTVGQVVDKQLLELESQLLAKGVELEVSVEAREWLVQKGYDRLMGARPMARGIQDEIKKPLAEEILFGKLENGGQVKILVSNGVLAFEIHDSLLNRVLV